MSLSFLSFNARGLRNILKRKAVFLFIKQFKCDFCFIQESHSTKEDLNFWKSQWGKEIWGAHGSKKMAGVLILKDKFLGEIIHHYSDPNGHLIIMVLLISQNVVIISNVYGYNSPLENSQLFDLWDGKISLWLKKYPEAFLIFGGDFNVVNDNTLDRHPPKKTNPNNKYLDNFMDKFEIVDAFRAKFPSLKSFTWHTKDYSKQSRIDYWLTSKRINVTNIDVNSHPAPFSDHMIVTLKLTLSPMSKIPRAVCWKINNSLLSHNTVIEMTKKIIQSYWEEATEFKIFSPKWELLKFDIGKFMRSYSSNLAKLRRKEENELCSKIATLSNKSSENIPENELIELGEYQNKLEEMYKRKTQGAFIRSRAKWMEEGEQCSSYFFGLENSNFSNNSLDSLQINNKIETDHKILGSFCSDFYNKLYSSNYSEIKTRELLDSIKHCKIISETHKKLCDASITLEEVQDAIMILKKNKSPGNDGLSSEFYKNFSTELSPFILETLTESINLGKLPPTLTQGIISLIPKPNKNKLQIDNWRPISLLNNDYKILALILAKRIKQTLTSIIDESQSGFMSNRHITNNIRLVLDLLDYSELINENSFILFLDFYKAFDCLEHEFIYRSLEKFGFGPFFIKAIKTLYNNSNSTIKLKYGTSPRFQVGRGVRQGCPVSPYLFLLAAQLLAALIQENNIHGISVADKHILISQVADDTTLFLKNSDQIPVVINLIHKFSEASGLKLNINKCELLPISECDHSVLHGIPVKSQITYLGIMISKNTEDRCNLNFNPIIEKTKKRFNRWLQRDITLRGRTLLSKAEGISRLTYPALALNVNTSTCKTVDKMLYKFIWKNKTHYIKDKVLLNTIDAGGLNVLDFTTLNYTFKINWIKKFLSNPDSLWNFIPNYLFSKLGGLPFLLQSNYNIQKLPIKLANFHKQMLLAWSLIYKHSFSPHRFYIWNNTNILYKNKSLFFPYWFQNNILYVNQLFNSGGCLMSYNQFLTTYNIPVTPKEFAIVMDAIPKGVIMLFKGLVHPLPSHSVSLFETNIGKTCFTRTSTRNKKIRSLFQKDIAVVPYVTHYWRKFAPDIEWKKVWTLSSKYFISNKPRDVCFKLLHRCYPAKSSLHIDIDKNCSFCKLDTETIIHLFWKCPPTVIFWKDFTSFVRCKVYEKFDLVYKDVLFGFYSVNNSLRREYYLINLLIILAKFHIHKCKFSEKKPLFKLFMIELNQYIKAIKYSSNPKAIRTFDTLEFFKCTE
uniref:Reverse transcriptase domain-containing protein n=1 Tax=Oryzias latipes TaxID=8090 RepID=A0A3P9L5I7_ORYLA